HPPPEGKSQPPIIPRRFIRQQRVAPLVLAFPDQPRHVLLLVEHAIHPQRIRPHRHHAAHGGPGKIHGPEPRIEPLHPVLRQTVRRLRQPVRHVPPPLILFFIAGGIYSPCTPCS